MRSQQYIHEHFPIEKLEEFEFIFNSPKFTREDKLTAAKQFLNIDILKFDHIPFLNDKKALLNYKYYLTYFEVCPVKLQNQFGKLSFEDEQRLNKFNKLAKIARDILLIDLNSEKHPEQISKFAQGLSDVFLRSGEYYSENNTLENDNNDKSEINILEKRNPMMASVIAVDKKRGGIEPGFIAIHRSDIIDYLINHFGKDEESLKAVIEAYNGDFELLYNEYKDELPTYLYKLDYKTDSRELPKEAGATPVYLTTEDVKRTSNVKKVYNKFGHYLGEIFSGVYASAKNSTALAMNTEAILETLSNDFSSFFMGVQQQKLFITTYPNKALKIMPQAAWVGGAEQFGSEEKMLAGGGDDTNNYRVNKLLMTKNGILSVPDSTIKNMPRLLIPLLFTGDYDKIGSKGQNLLVTLGDKDERTGEKTSHVIGIDFGHTLRTENNALYDQKRIQADARFVQPSFNHPFKNFTALTDGSLSEKIEGALILARLRGYKIDDAIIASYGNEFQEFYNAIPSGEGNTLCDNYIAVLRNLGEMDYDNFSEYQLYINAVTEFKTRMNTSLDKFISLFEKYLHYPKDAIDLAENLNKFSAAVFEKTSLRSKNHEHGLNHITIHDDYLKTWDIAIKDGLYYFSCPFDAVETNILFGALAKYFHKNPSEHITMKHENGEVLIQFAEIALKAVAEIFKEENLKNKFHKNDFKTIKAGQAEVKLRNLIHAPWFVNKNILMDLSLNPVDQQQYRLSFSIVKEGEKEREDKSEILLGLFENQFHVSIDSIDKNTILMDFPPRKLFEVIEKLDQIQNQYHALFKVDEISTNETHIATNIEKNLEDEKTVISKMEYKRESTNEYSVTLFPPLIEQKQSLQNSLDDFNKGILNLCVGYKKAKDAESTANSSSIWSSIGSSLYNFGRDTRNFISLELYSSTDMMSRLKNYSILGSLDLSQQLAQLEKVPEIVESLKKRVEHVNVLLLKPDLQQAEKSKYLGEIKNLESAIKLGEALHILQNEQEIKPKGNTILRINL